MWHRNISRLPGIYGIRQYSGLAHCFNIHTFYAHTHLHMSRRMIFTGNSPTLVWIPGSTATGSQQAHPGTLGPGAHHLGPFVCLFVMVSPCWRLPGRCPHSKGRRLWLSRTERRTGRGLESPIYICISPGTLSLQVCTHTTPGSSLPPLLHHHSLCS